jgi:radical SAM superfamily enzyme YgiQ (UPF0313 family)
MMKVLLIYPNVAKTLQIPMGLAYISSYLKENGVEVFLWDGTFETVDFLKIQVKALEPDVICFSALSPDYNFVEKLAMELRIMTNAPFVIGGYHATFAATSDIFDFVIKGEAECSLLDYLEGKSLMSVITGKLADINELPWPDHKMFKRHFTKQLNWESDKHKTSGVFLTARGCPFRCTYCSCDSLAKLYEEKITRFRDVDDIISEVATITDIHEMDMVWFTDETFTVNKKRTIELCKKYRDSISVPFSVETRPDTVNEEVLVALKEAGCVTIRMGIESGVDRIRNGLYKRNMSREKILDAFHTAKKVGLKTTSYNIIGAPTETIRDIRATISLNVECGVESGKMTLLSVFPGTRLCDSCKENGYEIRESYP